MEKKKKGGKDGRRERRGGGGGSTPKVQRNFLLFLIVDNKRENRQREESGLNVASRLNQTMSLRSWRELGGIKRVVADQEKQPKHRDQEVKRVT